MYWTYFTNHLKWISAGSAVYGVKFDGTVVRHDGENDSWIAYPPLANGKTADKVFCGNDDTIFALESGTGLCYRYNHIMNRWYPFHDYNTNFKVMDVANNNQVYATQSSDVLYRYLGEGVIRQCDTNIIDVGVARDGTAFAVTKNNVLHRIRNGAPATSIYAEAKLVCVQSAAHMIFVNKNNQILSYVGEGYFTSTQDREKYWDKTEQKWKYQNLPIPTETGIVRMTISDKGTCYIQVLQPDNGIFTYHMIPRPPDDEDEHPEPEYVKLKVEEVEPVSAT